MKFSATTPLQLSIGQHVPALILIFELDAEPVSYIAGQSPAELDELVHRLMLEHGEEWCEALLRVIGQEAEVP